MKRIIVFAVLLGLPCVAQDRAVELMTLSEVEAALDVELDRVASTEEATAVLHREAAALIAYRATVAGNAEIQALDAERNRIEEELSIIIQARDARERALQQDDSTVQAAKEALDEARGDVENLYRSPLLQELESRRLVLSAEAAIQNAEAP